jgi:hypothetical protein
LGSSRVVSVSQFISATPICASGGEGDGGNFAAIHTDIKPHAEQITARLTSQILAVPSKYCENMFVLRIGVWVGVSGVFVIVMA